MTHRVKYVANLTYYNARHLMPISSYGSKITQPQELVHYFSKKGKKTSNIHF